MSRNNHQGKMYLTSQAKSISIHDCSKHFKAN
jgi:hypothetical protein